MRLRTRYLLSLLALVALMTVPALYGVGRVRDLRDAALDLRQQAARTAVAAGRLSRQVAELDRYQRVYVAAAEADLLVHVHLALDAIQGQADLLARAGYGELVAAAVPVADLRLAADTLQALVEGGALNQATEYLADVARPLLASTDQGIGRLAEAIDARSEVRAAEARRLAASAATATSIAIALALLAALLLAWLAAHLLTRPLERLGKAMARVAEGRLDGPTDPALDRHDEVGDLFRSLRAMTARLSEFDRMKARFLGVASHDLKTPATLVAGYAELLDEAGLAPKPEQRRILEAMQEQARLVAERVDQFLEMSRLETRGLRVGLEEINIRHFAAGLQAAHAPQAKRQRVEVVVSVAPDAPTFIVGDPDCLRTQVLGNLVGHSIKFSPPGSVVSVDFRGGGAGCVVEVRDQGPAVPPGMADRLFDRNYRGAAPPGRVGSGVALPIAHEGVLAHGGTLAVGSDDRGTAFLVDLPTRPTPSRP
jgi:signal transduction histidine kinase